MPRDGRQDCPDLESSRYENALDDARYLWLHVKRVGTLPHPAVDGFSGLIRTDNTT